jgi:hypothetical protein
VTSPNDTVDPADIRRVDDAQIVWTDAVPTVGGVRGQVRLEPEMAQAISAKLGEITRTISELERRLSPVKTTLPTVDPVSNNAAIQAWKMIDESREYLMAWRTQLFSARAALDSQIAAYQQVERQNEARS